MIAFRLNIRLWFRRTVCVAFGLALPFAYGAVLAPSLAAQQAGADTQTAEDAAEEGTANSAQKTPQADTVKPLPKKPTLEKKAGKSLYFLGVSPQLKRQLGPAIGKPTNILPRPFVPLGSVQVPPAPTELALETETEGRAASSASINASDPEAAQILKPASGLETEQALAAGGLDNPPPVEATDMLEAGALTRLDPSGTAVLGGDAAFGAALWQGYDRAGIIGRMGEFSETSGSPILAQIANKIALSGTVFEGDSDDQHVLAFVEARLSLLQNLGNVQGYSALLAALPSSYDWTALSRHFTNAYLLDGKIGDACSLASEQREHDADAYWLRMVAFCAAARGNRAAVDFQLGILEEVSDVQPTFYQLIDQILVEAEQPPGAVLPATITLPEGLRVDVLEATMARLARVKVPVLALDGVNPLAVQLMLSLPGVSDEAKADLMRFAVRRILGAGDLLAAFARALDTDAETETAALQMQAEDDRFTIDAILLQKVGRSTAIKSRGDAIRQAWDRALKNGYTAVAGRSLLVLTSDLPPSPNDAAVMARAAMVAGQKNVAFKWFEALRSQAAGDNELLDEALVSLAPLVALSTTDGSFILAPDMLKRWWQLQGDRSDRFERANLLFTVLEAFGNTIDDEAWGWLEDGPVVFSGPVTAPAQWRRFLLAASRGDTPKALVFAFRLISEGGTAAVSASLAGSLLSTLDRMGLRQEARITALEILISQGL